MSISASTTRVSTILKKLENGSDCSICLEDMLAKKTEIVITKCSHAFHEKCLTQYLDICERNKKACPLCVQLPLPLVRGESSPDLAETNQYIEPEIVLALRNGDLSAIQQELKVDPSILNKLFRTTEDCLCDRTLLALAAGLGKKDIFTFLLNASANINETDTLGKTALMLACEVGNKEIVRSLLEKHANTKIRDLNGNDAFQHAVKNGKYDIVKMMVNEFKLPISNKNAKGKTALYLAAQDGHTNIVELLIELTPKSELKAVLNDQSAIESSTALFIAAQNGHVDVVSKLLLAGANPNLAISQRRTPLIIASKNGYLEIAQILIAAGAKVNTQSDTGFTALYSAAHQGHDRIVYFLLLNAKADKSLGYQPYFFSSILTPEGAARQNGFYDLADFIANFKLSANVR